MKLIKISFLIILGLLVFTSCNNDDDSIQPVSINGVWNLKNVRGGFVNIDIDYNLGDVIWDFDLSNNTVTVQNNILTTGPEYIYAGPVSGTYPISIEQNGPTEILIVDNLIVGNIILQGSNLVLDGDIASDGFLAEFER